MALADAILKDPDVTSLTSYIGIDGTNTTLNNGRFLINLKAARRSLADAPAQIARRLQDEVANVSGIKLYLQPEQDLTLDTDGLAEPVPVRAARARASRRSSNTCPELVARMKKIKSITDVTSDLNNEGLSVNVEVNRQLAARYGITPATIDNALYDALGPAHRLHHLQSVQPVPRDPGGEAREPAEPAVARQPVSADPDQQHRPGAAERHRRHQGHQVAAGDQPSGAVSRGDHVVQPRARRLAERGRG